MSNFHEINYKVMTDTMEQCESTPELKKMISDSIHWQFMVAHSENIDQPQLGDSRTKYYMTGERAFSEARKRMGRGRKVAVLNFANNHSIGGAPYAAGAQEESLCRCSTLLPCLKSMEKSFYQHHRNLSSDSVFCQMGNDDLIYTSDVCVFKNEELYNGAIIPVTMFPQDWFKVDVITCAAPDFRSNPNRPLDYESQMGTRIKKILDVAKLQHVDVLILGAWGCGAFNNPSDIVARLFHNFLKKYDFDTVVFAMGGRVEENSPFYLEFKDCLVKEENSEPSKSDVNDEVMASTRDTIISLLRSTGRMNIDKVIGYMEQKGFFVAPASVVHHNNFKGGLAKHSLEVYQEAVKLNEQDGKEIPQVSIILASLLHDICKADQYAINEQGKPISVEKNLGEGHGERSMFIVMRDCMMPLNYDEAMAIWWHMGTYELPKDKDSCVKKLNEEKYQESLSISLCQLIHKADGIAAHKA